MHALILSILMMIVPLLAAAEDLPLSATEFEARTTGRTLTYSLGNQTFGTEQYMPGRRVIWAFTGQGCQRGTWEEVGGHICFRYDDGEDPACWQFFDQAGRLTARLDGDAEGVALTETEDSAEPLSCPGPDLGV